MAQDPNRPQILTGLLRSRLRVPLTLTWAGLLAERLVQAFWPLWTLVASVAAVLMLGVQDWAMVELVGAALIASALGGIALLIHGVRRFNWPRRAEALARMDATLPGRPLQALGDAQAIGRGDAASEALWHAHLRRMTEAAKGARAVQPDLRVSRRDPFGLRYIALLGLLVALAFGSVWRVGSVAQIAPGAGALAAGPTWEGWVEPPAYTGLPSLYLSDLGKVFDAPQGSRVTLRFYGEVGALALTETVSGRVDGLGAATDSDHSFTIAQSGKLSIDGPGGRSWDVRVIPDTPPQVSLLETGARTTFDGQMSQPFEARDDYGITKGTATFSLNLDQVDRRFGLTVDPEPREPITLDLPLPIAGSRAEFSETLVENLSQHPWAHLPVTLTLGVEDAEGQSGDSQPLTMSLPARRFFDPLAASVIEQRRDLLWSRENGTRVAQVLRAVTYAPEEGLFRKETSYLRLRVILRRLETLVAFDGLTTEARDELAAALWDLALQLEDGDIGDALERMRKAQERLSEAMRNDASDDEIARLMQELRDATDDYLRQKSQQAERDGGPDQPDQSGENAMQLSQQDLQDMMDRIQDLMEQGRMAEAEQALREFQEMMENLRVTEGQGQQGQSPGEQAMEGLADTLREQQGLSDQAFRDLQEQFNSGAQAGESQGNEGRNGGEGRGQSHEGQNGSGSGSGAEQGQSEQQGEGADPGTLAQRQEALRRELERQNDALPGSGEAGEAARDALERAGRAMEGAEDALRQDNLAEAIDRQSEAMEALREGMRNLGESMAQENQSRQGGQGQARGSDGGQQSDPLGRVPGQGDRLGSQDSLLQGEDVYRRARELLDEIRRRSGEGDRPEVERNYLERLLERF
ncbi:TIGR02302 family protein [Roseovarius aestuarii]|nr:TIGR02302 family protein [Roseovarius aestuarii]